MSSNKKCKFLHENIIIGQNGRKTTPNYYSKNTYFRGVANNLRYILPFLLKYEDP